MRGALVLVCFALLPPHATADDRDAPDPCEPQEASYASCPTQIRFQIENDNQLFAFYLPFSSDERYTNGWRLSTLSCFQVARPSPPPARRVKCPPPDPVARLAYAFARRSQLRRVRAGMVLGQTIYTPKDLSSSTVLTDERPYAGMAMLGSQVEVQTDARALAVELAAVWTGSTALGQEFQDTVHHLMAINKARGWGNQISSTGGVQGTARWSRTFLDTREPMSASRWPRFAAGYHAMTSLGVIHGRVGAGLSARLGAGWPVAEEDPAIQQAFEKRDAQTGWYEKIGVNVLVRVDGRLIFWNALLEGPYLTDDSVHTVDAAPAVGDLEAGASLRWGPVQVTWIYVVRSSEIDDPRVDDGAHDFREIQATFFW